MITMSNGADWFARKLGTPIPPAQPPQQAPQYVAPQPATYVPSQQPQYPPTVQATPQAERCPNCHSGNYGSFTPEARKRCYDCGYPLQQSGSGGGTGIIGQGGQAAGPATPAIQVETGGWNPQGIIGHIG